MIHFQALSINMIYLIILLLPIIWILGKYIYCIFNLRHYPPGPFPLPIIGNIHLMSSAPTEKLRDLAKIYGNVFSLSFGTNRVVILNTIEPIREALITKSSQFAGRPLIPSVKVSWATFVLCTLIICYSFLYTFINVFHQFINLKTIDESLSTRRYSF